MGLRIKPRHLSVLGELLTHGTAGCPAELLVGRGLPLAELEKHGLAERFTDPSRIFTERWRLTRAGDVFARFFTDERKASA